MVRQIKTSYSVLEVREQKHSDIAPIVLICTTTCEMPPKRRRIEIRNHRCDEAIYNKAKLIVKGDVITITETLIGNTETSNNHIRQLDALEVNFTMEDA